MTHSDNQQAIWKDVQKRLPKAAEEESNVRYTNVYPFGICGASYESRDKADVAADSQRIAVLVVEKATARLEKP